MENQGKNWYKMIQNGQMTDFGEILDQLQIQLCFKLNVKVQKY